MTELADLYMLLFLVALFEVGHSTSFQGEPLPLPGNGVRVVFADSSAAEIFVHAGPKPYELWGRYYRDAETCAGAVTAVDVDLTDAPLLLEVLAETQVPQKASERLVT